MAISLAFAPLTGFGPLQFHDRELRQLLQERKAAIIKMTRFRIENGERTNAAAIAEDERITGIEANAGNAGYIGIIGKSLIQEGIADNKGCTLEYSVTAKRIITKDLVKLNPEA